MTSDVTPTHPLGNSHSLLKLAASQKHQEWQDAQLQHAQSLEVALKQKEVLLQEEQTKMKKLKEDFKYNLKILAERDSELQRYDVVIGQFKATLQSRDGEVSDLKIQMDEMRAAAERNEKSQVNLQQHYQKRLSHKQAELEQFQKMKNEELQNERDEIESFRKDLQRQVRDLEEELDLQRRELAAGFDETIQRRDKEYREKMDQLSALVLTHEMKAKFLAKELELVRSSADKKAVDLAESDSVAEDLKKQLKHKEWESHDLQCTMNVRVKELEEKVQQMEQESRQLTEDFKRRHQELDRYAREKEHSMNSLKDAHLESERKFEGIIRDLRRQQELKENELRQNVWDHNDTLKDKEILIEKLQEECFDLKARLDAQIENHSQEVVSTEMKWKNLQQSEADLKQELSDRKDNIERYKRELSRAAARADELERSKAQVEVDWQRRCEDVQRQEYNKSEQLIQSLTRSRDEALAKVKELERELEAKDHLLRSISEQKRSKLVVDEQRLIETSGSQELGSENAPDSLGSLMQLEAQNQALKQTIHEMSKEMEKMAQQTDRYQSSIPLPEEYTKSLEEEMKQLKAKNRNLTEQLESKKQSQPDCSHYNPNFNAPQMSSVHAQGEMAQMRAKLEQHHQELLDIKRGIPQQQVILTGNSANTKQLKEKLRMAVHQISQLAAERQRLIHVGNRLRSEVIKLQRAPSRTESKLDEVGQESDGLVSARELSSRSRAGLDALEKLQYSLTKKELAFMKRGLDRQEADAEVIQVRLNSPNGVPTRDTDQEAKDVIEQQNDFGVTPSTSLESTDRSSTLLVPSMPVTYGGLSDRDAWGSLERGRMMSGSYSAESLRDVWRVLDEGQSPLFMRSPSPIQFQGTQPNYQSTQQGQNELQVSGHRSSLNVKPQPVVQPSSKGAGRVQGKQKQKGGKQIRNYSVKDGELGKS